MTNVAHDTRDAVEGDEQAKVEPDRNFWSGIAEVLRVGRQRALEREVADYIAANGGRMTDQIEREISDRLSTSGNFSVY